jgi:hypothetical protein
MAIPRVASWKRFQATPVGDNISLSDTLILMKLLGSTSSFVASELSAFAAKDLAAKINSPALGNPGRHPLPAGPEAGGAYNWMKASIGYDNRGNPLVGILYHLHRHRIVAGSRGFWGVSVGLDATKMPPVNTGDDPANNHPITPLVGDIASRIKDDLAVMQPFSAAGGGKYFVIYDHLGPHDAPGHTPGDNIADRRRNFIGEFGLVAQKSPIIARTISVISRTVIPRPTDKNDNPIANWRANVAETIMATLP